MDTTTLVRDDPGMTLAVLAAVGCALAAIDAAGLGWSAAAGAAAGVATGIKYSAFPVLVPALIAACGVGSLTARAKRSGAALAAFVVAVGVTNHFVWADFPNFLRQLADQVAITGIGHWAASANPAAVYVGTLASQGIGAPLVGAAAIYAVWALTAGRSKHFVFLAFPVLYMWFMAHRPAQFPRWVFPMLPFVAIASAAAVLRIARLQVPWAQAWRSRRVAKTAALIVCAALLVQAAVAAATAVSRRMRAPTFALAENWLRTHARAGDEILTESGWLHLDISGVTVKRVSDLDRFVRSPHALDGVDWVVVPEPDFGEPALARLAFEQRIHADRSFTGRMGYDYEIYRVPGSSGPRGH